MKHSEADRQSIDKVLRWVGTDLNVHQWDQLEIFASFLRDEAVVAGGIGPNEAPRIWDRHIADSLAFAYAWRQDPLPSEILDVGAGVGLPGIPLAVLWPQVLVTLLDRAGKRIDLARRVVRQMGLENVEVLPGEADSVGPGWDGAVFRAVLRPKRALGVASQLLKTSGRAVIGLRGEDGSAPLPPGNDARRPIYRVDIPVTVLDGPASLLIMGPREH